MEEATMMNDIQCFVEKQLESTDKLMPKLLPSMHSTDCLATEKILKNDRLDVQECPVFKAPLLYYFYGKPVYKVATKNATPRTDYLYSPCCFIIDSEKIQPKYIYPFDTGAHSKGIYAKILPPVINVHEFELRPEIAAIPGFIRTFFGDNTNYLEGACTISGSELTNNTMVSLAELLQAKGVFTFDDRSRTVEIISDCSVKLSDITMAVIVPRPFLRNEYFKEFMKEYPQIDILSYFTHYPTDPSSHNEVIYQKAMEYLSQKGGLS